jgi:hypothetical protein
VTTVVKEVCAEFQPVNIELATKHLDLDSVASDPEAVDMFRRIEANEARRKSCAGESK